MCHCLKKRHCWFINCPIRSIDWFVSEKKNVFHLWTRKTLSVTFLIAQVITRVASIYRLVPTSVHSTLPNWYDLRQYQPYTNTSLNPTFSNYQV
jgi:hypothetical protein